ncbi:PAS domain S-box-containing protein/diguanylate cyclase (GGDEF)-like protein [Pseudomonas duriflava]|uniref:PAS domain S-box-containing protein/diguanylate cyclase (GGDEF)-like protein n=1 Tax=Pseudomonas duriflava TaxID=459528 RepID=A0A562Q735_9PSED|nr:EAL domain-containing protein [Pseudomonas duriflava]TWI52543.1 PAS domain S-box-containing protein/diguanylate cyclase (GGDEF)-like protein [Pseudomonas duriflava]
MPKDPQESALATTEYKRLARLRTLGLLDTDAEPVFNRVTELAVQTLDVPIALVTLVDSHRQWFKSRVGMRLTETPREQSFCAHAIKQNKPLIVTDALNDPRFAENPLVVGEPKVRFYAGIPVTTMDGYALGTLCIIDTRPRQLTNSQIRTLQGLADIVTHEIQSREAELVKSAQLLTAQEQAQANASNFRTIFERAGVGIALVSLKGQWLDVNDTLCSMLGYSREELLKLTFQDITVPADLPIGLSLVKKMATGEIDQFQLEKRYIKKDRSPIWINLMVTKQQDHQEKLTHYVCVIQDIQDRKSAEESLTAFQHKLEQTIEERTSVLLKREAELSAILENTSDAYIGMDENGIVTAWNRKAEEIFLWSREEAVGRLIEDLIIPPAFRVAHREGIKRYFTAGEIHLIGKSLEYPALRKDGVLIPIEIRVTAVHIEDRTIFTAFLQDITERKLQENKRLQDAQEDALTGLANRRAMYSFLEAKLKTRPTLENPLQLFYLDLDSFKPVNDTLGHAAGDQVLVEIARRLKECMRDDDLVARIGGDEFVIVASGMSGQLTIEKFCRRLLETLRSSMVIDKHEVNVGCSIGIVSAPQDSCQADDLLRFADIALYEAKAAGRNTWQFYTAQMSNRLLLRRQIETDLRLALRRSELRLEFQPRYEVQSGRLMGAEALVRWQHPIRGYLSPDDFIVIAEESGLIVPLSDWVLHQACLEATTWKDSAFVSVNLCPLEFKQGNLVSRIRAVLDGTGLLPERLELEITENVMLEDADEALLTMNELKALGVRLSMDDFGTGYSSLSYIHTYPFDGIKIDRSFIAALDGSANGEAIIEAIVGLGQALSLTITAEGVETQEQLDLLIRLHCNQAQGFYLGRPMPVEGLKVH